MTDFDIIKEVKQGNYQNFDSLVSNYTGLLHQLGSRYVLASSGRCEFSDIISETEVVFRAAQSYPLDSEYAFSTFVGQQLKYSAIKNLNSLGMAAEIPVEQIDTNEFAEENLNVDDIDWIKNSINDLEDEQMKKVIEIRYFNKEKTTLPFNKIGEILNLSTQRVHQIHEKFVKLVREKLAREESMMSLA